MATVDPGLVGTPKVVTARSTGPGDDDLAPSRLLAVLAALAGEYANVAGALCGDIRVPKDLRDELAAHVSEVLAELPEQVRSAIEPA